MHSDCIMFRNWKEARTRPFRWRLHGKVKEAGLHHGDENHQQERTQGVRYDWSVGFLNQNSKFYQPPQYSQNVWLLFRWQKYLSTAGTCFQRLSLQIAQGKSKSRCNLGKFQIGSGGLLSEAGHCRTQASAWSVNYAQRYQTREYP